MTWTKRRRVVVIALALLALLAAFNASVAIPAGLEIKAGGGDGGATMLVYRSWLVSPTDVTVDLLAVSDETRPVDMFRDLFRAASALKGRRFHTVTLARRGMPVFTMDGADFQTLGLGYGDGGNPIPLISHLPQSLKRLDGTAAFGTWEGGWLGVFSKQMEDVNRFALAWITGKAPPVQSLSPDIP